jgi:hypothetical protein
MAVVDEADGVGVAVAAPELGTVEVLVEALVGPLVELPVDVAAVEVLGRWACAACPTNRPRLAAPAVITTATANRARPRILFMAQPWRSAFWPSCVMAWRLL